MVVFDFDKAKVPVSARETLSELFVEEPVPLPIFVSDKKFMDNPPLSPIQYDAVRHIEQIFFDDTYALMAEGFGTYWNPVRRINYATLMFGKGCILPDEEIYDPVACEWTRVDECVSAGNVLGRAETLSTTSSRRRTAAYPHGVGNCVEVETASGRRFRAYEGHQVYTAAGKPVHRRKPKYAWKELRHLGKQDRLVIPSAIECKDQISLREDAIWLYAFWVAYGSVSTLDSRNSGNRPKIFKEYVERLESVVGEPLYLDPFFSWETDFAYLPKEVRENVERFLKDSGVKYTPTGEVVRLPAILYKADDASLGMFFRIVLRLVAEFFDISGYASEYVHGGRPRFIISMALPHRLLAEDVANLLMRFNVFADISDIKNPRTPGKHLKYVRKNCLVRIRTDFDVGTFLKHVDVDDEHASMPMRTFAESFYKEGKPERIPDNRKNAHEVWDKVKKLRPIGVHEFWNLEVPNGEHYVGSGGILHHNSGKDHVCRVSALRIAYLLQCLRSPQEYFGLASQDDIHLLNVASNSRQANRAYFNPLRKVVARGWFADKCEPVMNGISWDKSIEMISGHSDADSQEGMNLLLGIADEIDAFKSDNDTRGSARGTDYVNSAESIMKMLRSSAKTRFPESHKIVTISYPRYVGSPIMASLAQAKQDIERKGQASRYYASGPHATWDVHPNRKRSEFDDDYEQDPIGSRTQYECKPERALNPFFRNTGAIRACTRKEPSPVEPDYLLEQRDGGAQIWVPTYDLSGLTPRAGAQYVIHADLAVKHDRAGVAMAHVADWQEIESIQTLDDGSETSRWESRPNVVVDFVFGYEADLRTDPPREIQVRWFRQLVTELRNMGFNIACASHDGFGSVDSLQIMAAQGIHTKKLSTDTNLAAWNNLRDLLYEGRVSMPNSEILSDELRALTKMNNGKVDHPGGSGQFRIGKDLADAVACACLSAVTMGGAESGGDAESSSFDFSVASGSGMESPLGMKKFLAPDADSQYEDILDEIWS